MTGPQGGRDSSSADGGDPGTSPSAPSRKPGNSVFAFEASSGVKKFARKYRTEISASTSSIISTFVAFPLDFTKSRMQSYNGGLVHTVVDAYRAEGLRAFWRGVMPPLASVTIVRTASFSIYQRVKYALDRNITHMTGESPLKQANAPGGYPSALTVACFGLSGASAGAVITFLSCPFELTKLNEQLAGKEARNGNHHKAGSWATAQRLVRDRGFSGLYSGFRLHLLRDTIGTSIYFMTYESVKQLMANSRGKSPTSPYAVVVAGGLCGIVSWACIYPIDVAKTLYQKQLLSAGSGYAERPPIRWFANGAYRGLGVSVVRSCVLNALFFSNFEMMKSRINTLDV